MKEQTQQSVRAQVKNETDLKRLYAHIHSRLRDVEKALQRLTRSSNPLIAEINAYLFDHSGKRIRPALLLLSAGLSGRVDGNRAVECGALVELLHTASLLHDDIIDHSDLRRGRKTVHVKWGPNITVLLGDFLYIKSLARSLSNRLPGLARILTDVSTQMIEGELAEYRQSGNLDLTEKDYLDIIRRKTASLFSASCRIGGMLGGLSAEKENALAEYGTCLGMSFQIIDDLLDYTGDEKTMGKPALSDLAEGRVTLPLIRALRHQGAKERKRLRRLFGSAIIREGPALGQTYRRAEAFSRRASEALKDFPPSPHKQSLSLLTRFVLERNR